MDKLKPQFFVDNFKNYLDLYTKRENFKKNRAGSKLYFLEK